jgi:hypothetical protein
MNDPTNRPPLWQVMDIAKEQTLEKDDQCHERFMYAAELRAIARWIEDRTAATTAFEPGEMPVIWRVVGMLLAEADRAEAGE